MKCHPRRCLRATVPVVAPRDVCTPCPCGACVLTAIILCVQRSRSFMVMTAVVRLPRIVWELVLLPGTLPTSSSPCHCPSCLLCSVLTACARVTCALTADLLCEQRSSCDGISASRTSQPSPCPWCFVHAVLAPLPVRAPFDSIRGCAHVRSRAACPCEGAVPRRPPICLSQTLVPISHRAHVWTHS